MLFIKSVLFTFVFLSILSPVSGQYDYTSFRPGKIWEDNTGRHINAHGGGILYHNGIYYWYGESKDAFTNTALDGVSCYSSSDLYNWKNEGISLAVQGEGSPIEKGCIIERPKVIFNALTQKFVMYFHLELKGQEYKAAQYGVAVSDKVTGPFEFLYASRSCPGTLPVGAALSDFPVYSKTLIDSYESKTAGKRDLLARGIYFQRDMEPGQMARDMTLFVDDDGTAYHIFSSEENSTLHIVKLTADYLHHSCQFKRVLPGLSNEAPAVFKYNGRYWMITSACTGWKPNPARMAVADSLFGEWEILKNPCVGKEAETTFFSQSTHVLPVVGKKDAFIFMGDRWTPEEPRYGKYIWLPIRFKNGVPMIEYLEEWDLNIWN